MDFIMEDNDYSEEEEGNELAEYPEWFLVEESYFQSLNNINKFKEHISLEPEFYGIKMVKSGDILNIFNNVQNISCAKTILTEYQTELFEDLHMTLFGNKNTTYNYNKMAHCILTMCYI